MHIECGTVIELNKGKILVESAPETGCSSCAAKGTCLTGGDSRKKRLWIENTLGASPGDMVSFRIEEKGVVLASVLLYLLPVIFLVGGAVAGAMLAPDMAMETESGSAVGGIAGIILAFIFIYVVSKIKRMKNLFSPVLLEILLPSRQDF